MGGSKQMNARMGIQFLRNSVNKEAAKRKQRFRQQLAEKQQRADLTLNAPKGHKSLAGGTREFKGNVIVYKHGRRRRNFTLWKPSVSSIQIEKSQLLQEANESLLDLRAKRPPVRRGRRETSTED
mmetsp:Transcript_33149/g.65035  ORF Transcript_33149/g.65035 Transcript_33149/m.65035 type:complete len:125 (-) Transcript_33149:250-624(-)